MGRDSQKELPGLKSDAKATIAPSSMSARAGGPEMQVRSAGWKHDGRDFAPRQEFGPPIRRGFEVVHASRTELYRQRYGAALAELIPVHAQRKPVPGASLQVSTGLGNLERPTLHEHVGGPSVTRGFGQNLLHNEIDVIPSVSELGRHRVRPEEGRHHVHRGPRGGLVRGPQLLKLRLVVQAIPGLDLGRRGPVLQHPS